MVEIYREHLRVVHDRRRPSVTRAALYFVAPRSLRCACRVVHISSDLRIFEHRDISVPCLSLSRVSDSRTEYFTVYMYVTSSHYFSLYRLPTLYGSISADSTPSPGPADVSRSWFLQELSSWSTASKGARVCG